MLPCQNFRAFKIVLMTNWPEKKTNKQSITPAKEIEIPKMLFFRQFDQWFEILHWIIKKRLIFLTKLFIDSIELAASKFETVDFFCTWENILVAFLSLHFCGDAIVRSFFHIHFYSHFFYPRCSLSDNHCPTPLLLLLLLHK